MSTERHPHLSDEEIDLYCKGRLSQDRIRRCEEHYLECRDCLARVELIESLVGGPGLTGQVGRVGLAGSRAGLAVAAASVAGLLLGWQFHATWRPAQPIALAVPGPSTERGPERVPTALAEFTLQPPVRIATAAQAIRVPPGARFVVLALDALEIAPPGTVVSVRLRNARQESVAVLQGVSTDVQGLAALSVPSSLLSPGAYVLEVQSGTAVLEAPFRVQEPEARP
jgi:hypothetical protein